MKKGEVINGYQILQDFTTAGGGQSKWTFAKRSGREYFIKEFLSPTYPTAGSAETKKLKLRQCTEFEKHHRTLMEKLSSRSSEGGNLIVTIDFFRIGAKYYKVTDKVDVKGLTVAHIAGASLDKKMLIMLTVAHSLRILHQAGVVHGDLKPDNILIKESAKGSYVAKLIDFDNSYLSGKPPVVAEEVVGDPVYYSPELLRYITGDKDRDPSHLQLGSDIFALGLIYTEFLTGRLPSFDRKKYRYACEAVNAGTDLVLSGVPPSLDGLIRKMLHPRYDGRPTTEDIFGIIKGLARVPEASHAEPSSSGTLGGTMFKKTAAAATGTGLSGTLIRKKP